MEYIDIVDTAREDWDISREVLVSWNLLVYLVPLLLVPLSPFEEEGWAASSPRRSVRPALASALVVAVSRLQDVASSRPAAA